MDCLIKTDDGYEKTIPWSDEMLNWPSGQEIEIYHSKFKWTASYTVHAISHKGNFLPQIDLSYIIETRKYDSPPHTVDLTNEIADADIIKKILKLSEHLK